MHLFQKDGEMKEGQKAGRDPDQSYLPKSDKNKDAHSPASIPQTFSGGETFLVLQVSLAYMMQNSGKLNWLSYGN